MRIFAPAARGLLAFVFPTATLVLTVGLAEAEEFSYRKEIRPLWTEKCGACHGADAPYYGDFKENRDEFVAQDLGPRMDTYADLLYFIGWPDTGAIMRRLDDGKHQPDGKPGNMYEYLGDDEAERQRNLETFKGWVGRDAWILNRWNARGEVPAVTKEQLSRLRLKY